METGTPAVSRPTASTVPSAMFSSAFQQNASHTEHTLAPPTSADDDLRALHIAVTPQPSASGSEFGDSDSDVIDTPDDSPLLFHSDPADDANSRATSPMPLSASNSLLPPPHPSHSSGSPISSAPVLSVPSAVRPTTLSASAAASDQCKVVSCTAACERDGFCLPHHGVFFQAPRKASADGDAGRERKERKNREAQLAAVRQKSSTMPMPAPSSPSLSTNSTSSSPSSSPSWFARRKSSHPPSEVKDDDGGQRADPIDALLTETRRAWKSADRVVCKDLPRLAKRTSVVNDKRVCVLFGRLVADADVIRATKPRASVPTRGLSPQEEDEDEPGSSPRHAAPSPLPVASAVNEAIAGTDPPSPKSRVKGVDESQLADIGTWAAVMNVVLAVAQHLESDSTLAALSDAFERSAVLLTPQSDLESALSDVFASALPPGSQTFAVFRACHQSILFPAVFQLKTQLYPGVGQMKDVRRHDGWTVEIYIGDGRVWITHLRTEQSMEAEDDPMHFECVWELRVSFDRAMTDCRAVILRIQELHLNPAMPRERKDHIVEVLKGNGYIV